MEASNGTAQRRGRSALVTGATGFVGGHLVSELLAQGWSVRALVRDPVKGASLARRGVTLFQGDLERRDSLTGIADGISVVFHCAAKLNLNVPTKADDDSYHRANVQGLENLVAAIGTAPIDRFVHLSSLAAIGIRPVGRIDESFPCNPDLAYGVSKLKADEYLLGLARLGQLPTVVLRPPTVYGPGERMNFLSLCRAIHSGAFIHVGRGWNRIDFCWVGNLVLAMIAAAERGRVGEVYLVTDSPPLPFRETVSTLHRLLGGRRLLPLYVPVPVAYALAYPLGMLGARLGKAMPLYPTRVRTMSGDMCFDISKARRELGYEPRGPFAANVADTIEWYRAEGLLA